MKKFLRRLPGLGARLLAAFILLFVILAVLYRIFITPAFVKEKVDLILEDVFTAKVRFAIKRVSLINGIEIAPLVIRNPDPFSRTDFLSIKSVRIRYNLLALLFLKVRISDITIQDPSLSLEYSSLAGKWNFASLLKSAPGEKKTVSSRGPLGIDVKLRRFRINNLRVEVKKGFYFLLKGLNFSLNFNLSRVSLEGIRRLRFQVFPSSPPNVIFRSGDVRLVMPFPFRMDLDLPDRRSGRLQFSYILNRQLIEIRDKFISLPDISVLYDSRLDLDKYYLIIDRALLLVNNNSLLNLKGTIMKFNKDARFDIASGASSLDLNGFEDLFRSVLKQEQLNISGRLGADALSIGNPGRTGALRFSSSFRLRDLNFSLPESGLSIEDLELTAGLNRDKSVFPDAGLELKVKRAALPGITASNYNVSARVSFNNQGSLRSLSLLTRECALNRGILLMDLAYEKGAWRGKLILERIGLDQFHPALSGTMSLKNEVTTVEKGALKNSLLLEVPDFRIRSFVSNREYFSRTIPLTLQGEAFVRPGRFSADISELSARAGEVFQVRFSGRYDGALTGRIVSGLVRAAGILPLLPRNWQYAFPFTVRQGDLYLTGGMHYTNRKASAFLHLTNDRFLLEQGENGLSFHELKLAGQWTTEGEKQVLGLDLSLSNIRNETETYSSNMNAFEKTSSLLAGRMGFSSRAVLSPRGAALEKLELSVPDLRMHLDAKGHLLKKGAPARKAEIRFDCSPEKEIMILNRIFISGVCRFDSRLESVSSPDGMRLEGRFLFRDFSLRYPPLAVESMNGSIPFLHIVTGKLLDRKELLAHSLDNDFQLIHYPVSRKYRGQSDNLTVRRVAWQDIALERIAFDMDYANNFLGLRRVYLELLGGSLVVNNSYFDLGNTRPETFRYKLNLEVSGIDLLKLRRVRIPKAEDTTIYANARLKGEGIDLTKSGDLSGSFHITHIGPELATRFLELLDPEGKDGGITLVKEGFENGAMPELISIELKYGRIFPRVWLKKPPLYKSIVKSIISLSPAFIVRGLPETIELEEKSADMVVKSFQKKKK